jgi:ankyrin repeat protein
MMKHDVSDPVQQLEQAWKDEDASLFKQVLDQHPQLKKRINEPVAAFDAPLVTQVRNRQMLDVLLEAGANINARSSWWAGGFGLLDNATPELAHYAIERGAIVDVHSASRLGLLGKLTELVSADPSLINVRGGDGQTPLHFASTVEVAEYLLDNGAGIDLVDVDHESTPAQYMVRDRQEVLRCLIRRGCRTDLLMASAIGNLSLVRQHLDQDPDCIRMRVNDQYFPMQNKKAGGTIYQWTLGFHVSAHQVAKQFGHEDIFDLLMKRSPPDLKLIEACWMGDEAQVNELLNNQPGLASEIRNSYSRHIADAARNNNTPAVCLMLGAGGSVAAAGQHGATPLHWAAFHGNVEMIKAILPHKPPLENQDADFHATPLGWAIHGSQQGWYCRTGNYAGTAELLLRAGAQAPEKVSGSDPVQEVLRAHAK